MNVCKIIDISIPMHGFIFPDNPKWHLKGPFNRVNGKNPEYVYDFELCSQSGTHIQGAHYFLENGKKISDYPLEAFEGDAYLVDCSKRGIDIERHELESQLLDIELTNKIVIIRTGHMDELLKGQIFNNSSRPGLSLGAAKYLCEEKGVKMIGIDSIGLESCISKNYDVNVYLCKQDVLILECLMNLDAVKMKRFWLEAYPLKIEGVEGTPCRAIIKERTNEKSK